MKYRVEFDLEAPEGWEPPDFLSFMAALWEALGLPKDLTAKTDNFQLADTYIKRQERKPPPTEGIALG